MKASGSVCSRHQHKGLGMVCSTQEMLSTFWLLLVWFLLEKNMKLGGYGGREALGGVGRGERIQKTLLKEMPYFKTQIIKQNLFGRVGMLHACHRALVEVRGQLYGRQLSPSTMGVPRINSSCQEAWQQMPLPLSHLVSPCSSFLTSCLWPTADYRASLCLRTP